MNLVPVNINVFECMINHVGFYVHAVSADGCNITYCILSKIEMTFLNTRASHSIILPLVLIIQNDIKSGKPHEAHFF